MDSIHTMRNIKFFSFINRVACKAGVLCSALVLARPSYLSFPVAFMMAAMINVPLSRAFVKKKTPTLQPINRAEHLLPALFYHALHLRLIGSLVLRR